MRELPTIASSAYASTTSSVVDLPTVARYLGLQQFQQSPPLPPQQQQEIGEAAWGQALADPTGRFAAIVDAMQQHQRFSGNNPDKPLNRGVTKVPNPTTMRRLVQVFIADPDENVPLDRCLLYSGEPKLTDLTDQELFFEVDIKTILDEHNAKRVLLVNKTVKERTERLEPARIRDLKMTVVTIASF